MERSKTVLLTLLVFLSLFLSYKLLYRPMGEEKKQINIGTNDIFTYKRWYEIKPFRESMHSIPSEELNEILIETMAGTKEIETSEEKNYNFDGRGVYVVAGFDVPVQGLFRSFKQRTPDLPFEKFYSFYLNLEKKTLQLMTDHGLVKFPLKKEFVMKEPQKYIQCNPNLSPAYVVGINEFAIEVNPVAEYTRGDRYALAEEFLKEQSLAETEEEKGWLYTSSEASIFLRKDGMVEYRRRPSSEMQPANLYDSLLALKQFIYDSPLSFSSYRIVDMDLTMEGGEEIYEIRLLQGELPQFAGEKSFTEVRIANNRVTYFRYNANYLRNYDELFRGPRVEPFVDCFVAGEDCYPFYKRANTTIENVLRLVVESAK